MSLLCKARFSVVDGTKANTVRNKELVGDNTREFLCGDGTYFDCGGGYTNLYE